MICVSELGKRNREGVELDSVRPNGTAMVSNLSIGGGAWQRWQYGDSVLLGSWEAEIRRLKASGRMGICGPHRPLHNHMPRSRAPATHFVCICRKTLLPWKLSCERLKRSTAGQYKLSCFRASRN